MRNTLSKKNDAWAAEMRAAQTSALPTAIRSGNGVFLLAGSADEELLDADPAPGIQARWIGNAKKGNVMGKVVDRQMSEPTITVPLAGSAVKTQGTFAGPSGGPFSICHLSGNKFWIEGGTLTFDRLVGYQDDDDETPIFETTTYEIESKSIFVDQRKTTLIGFRCRYAKRSEGDWDLEIELTTKTIDARETVTTGPVAGMRIAFNGSPIVTTSYTPIGDEFLPWIALHTTPRHLDWKQSVGILPTVFLSPSHGFSWWS